MDACGVAVSVPNIHPSPSDAWRIASGEIPDGALGVFHSHPCGPNAPSGPDMQYAYTSALPQAIATLDDVFWFGDGVPVAPFIGRTFRHGVTDCYELIRDTYSELWGVSLPYIPREWNWWKRGDDLYNDGFKDAGFAVIDSTDILPGDVLLFSIHTAQPMHAAIWLGRDLILHHMSGKNPYDPERLSKIESIDRWGRFITKALRYENNPLDRTACQKIRL